MGKILNFIQKIISVFLIVAMISKLSQVSSIVRDYAVSVCCEEAPDYGSTDSGY